MREDSKTAASKNPCSYCGLPLRGIARKSSEAQFCCLGCAMADSVTRGSSEITAAQKSFWSHLLSSGFLFFNQAFFLLLSLAFRVEGEISANHWTLWFSQVAGLALLTFLAWLNHFHGSAGKGRWFLWLLWTVAVLGTLLGFMQGRSDLATAMLLMLSALAAWSLSRGLVRKASRDTPSA